MDRPAEGKRTLWLGLLLCVLTVVAFGGVVHNGFINYDDGDYITENPHVAGGLTWANFRWAFTTTHGSNWHPITWLSHMLDVQLFGLNPTWHHLTSLSLHVLNVVLVFLLLYSLTGALWRSFFVAAFFALHPLRVEAVAWAAERKGLLSSLFFLTTIWAYARYAKLNKLASTGGVEIATPGVALESSTRDSASESQAVFLRMQSLPNKAKCWYVLALGFYALGLMSKPMLVTLPFVLLLLDYWPLGRLAIKNQIDLRKNVFGVVIEKLPFFCLAAISSLVTYLAMTSNQAVVSGLPVILRIENAIVSYVQYLGKMCWPVQLAIFYPHPNVRYFAPSGASLYPASDQWPVWQIAAALIFLACFSVLVWLRRQHQPWAVVGWFWFLGTLVPVIGLIQAGVQGMADRYSYIPLLGIFILITWGGAEFARACRLQPAFVSGAGLLLLLGCVVVTRYQIGYWRDNQTLFTRALAVTSRNSLAEWMVGAGYANRGHLGLAQTHFRLALVADPYQVEAHSALGSLFELEQKPDLALQQYQETLRLKPRDEFARVHYAALLRKMGRATEALTQYKEALRFNPDSVEASCEVGSLALDAGDLRTATAALENALALKPNHPDALICLSDLRAQQGQFLDAANALQRLVALYPTNAELRVNLGGLFWQAGRRDEAVGQYLEAIRLKPSDPNAHYNLGMVWLAQKKFAEALREFAEAVRLKPDSADALSSLAWLLATNPQPEARDGSRALILAQRAVEISGGAGARYWASLDVAFAETGHFEQAIQAGEKVRTLAVASGDTEQATAAQDRIGLYRNQQPYRLR